MEEVLVARKPGTLTFDIFVKDWVDSGDIRVTYCPTEDMVANFFTKPLQGSAFIRF